MLNRRVLLVAFHYPPMAGSSGIQRTTRFAQYLPRFGWSPIVLTAGIGAYAHRDSTSSPVPAPHRAPALDTARHLSIGGRYPDFLSRPDRWVSWYLSAVPLGLSLIWRFRPHVIWSTYPIATAHLIAHRLQRCTGLPWVADFRDPMAHDGYPADPATWESFARVERKVFSHACRAVFTTESMRDFYHRRYGWDATRLHVIANGFDEESFRQAEMLSPVGPERSGPVLLHSGIVYPEWRNPHALFKAIRQMIDSGNPAYADLRLRFRGSGHDSFLNALAEDCGIRSHVELLPPVGYLEALREMLDAEGLLLIQSAGCNDQIPAKLYEYLRANRPIIGLADSLGDTARQLTHIPGARLADPEDPAAIAGALRDWMSAQEWKAPAPLAESISGHSRLAGSERLAAILDQLAEG